MNLKETTRLVRSDDEVGAFSSIGRPGGDGPLPREVRAPSARVILAEPGGPTRAALAAMLREDGHRIDTVEDAPSLLGRLRARRSSSRARGEVVVWGFDLRDPELMRWEAEVRRLAPAIPVILLSGSGWLATAGAALRLGAVAILRRPIDREVLRCAVRASLKPGSVESQELRLLRDEPAGSESR